MNVCVEHLPPPLADLLKELAQDHALGAGVPEFARCLRATDREADDNPHALILMQALSMIAAQKRPARDRFEDMAKVLMQRGKITVTVRVE